MTVGAAVKSVLFLIPFVLVGIGVLGAVFVIMYGQARVTIGAARATVFEGIGSIGLRRSFDPAQVTNVFVRTTQHSGSDGVQIKKRIVIDGEKQIRFGMGLSDERMRYLAGTLRSLLLPGPG